MEGLLVMSAKERERLKIFLRVKRGELQQKEAVAMCQLEVGGAISGNRNAEATQPKKCHRFVTRLSANRCESMSKTAKQKCSCVGCNLLKNCKLMLLYVTA